LKSRILDQARSIARDLFPREVVAALQEACFPIPDRHDALVFSDPQGLTVWVNGAFTDLCGYPLEELQGRKPGSLLQGPRTEPASVEALRQAVRNRTPVVRELVNYHKDGHPYRVEIDLRPVSAGFLALERNRGDLEESEPL
jgi:PAS domain S-box-containing protein